MIDNKRKRVLHHIFGIHYVLSIALLTGGVYGILFGATLGIILGITTGHSSTGVAAGVSLAIASAVGMSIFNIRNSKK